MSRIGNLPITIPEDVHTTMVGTRITVTGPKGTLKVEMPREIRVSVDDGRITLSRGSDQPKIRALHGLSRSLLANAVTGVTKGFSKTLEIKGVGFRAKFAGNVLVLTVGYSHPVEITQPENITFQVKGSKIIVSGIDKYQVGEVAAAVRRVRPPDAYKGKGIRYEGEYVRIKPGKAAKTAA